ncbi:MAG: glycosyltransferase [Alicyclobacillus herbarius]|uniref:glycosyltransferase n=1 Tax=Alicyclobacillus herbarius TaxID=122960 RepID=UPI0004179EE7|nr:glycosyltransferase [Alicyclobacillus herbarius]MCL6632366.1 glycosyltransferase [Alicyclobacillus herbarius]
MRIFFVLEHLGGRGGVETVLSEITDYLKDNGHEPLILLPHPSEHPEWERDLNVYYYDVNSCPSPSALENVANRIIGLSMLSAHLPAPDVVVGTHVPHTSLYGRMAFGHLKDVPIVSWLHGPPTIFNSPNLINNADLHWCISRDIAAMVADLTKNQKPVHWVGNPIEITVRPVQLVHDYHHYVYLGRLAPQKRLDIMFQALSRLEFPWSLEIYGDGPERDKLIKLSRELDIHQKITWHGWTTNPWERIERASALLLTSDFEGLPMVIGESLARGLPVISSDCPTGPKDLITDGENGLLFRQGDIDELYRQLLYFHSLSREDRENMGHAARQSVQKFSIEKVIHRMFESISPFIRQR